MIRCKVERCRAADLKWTCPVEVACCFRTLMPLVDYGSDSDQEAPNTPIATVSEPARSTGTTKRCALPSSPMHKVRG